MTIKQTVIKPFTCLAYLANKSTIFSSTNIPPIFRHLQSNAHNLTEENGNQLYLRMEEKFKHLIKPKSINYDEDNFSKNIRLSILRTATYASFKANTASSNF